MSPGRRDAEGTWSAGPTHESLVERLIAEAQQDGAFDDLPHRGEPLPPDGSETAGEMASAFRILRNAGAAPPWIEADKEARRLLAERDALLSRAAGAGALERAQLRRLLADVVSRANAAIDMLNVEAPTPRQQRRRLAPADELAALERAATDGRAPDRAAGTGARESRPEGPRRGRGGGRDAAA